MNHQTHNFVTKLTDSTCFVPLESFINCQDDKKSINLDLILEETKKYKIVFGSLVWENRSVGSWLPWVLTLREKRRCVLVFDSVYQNQIDEIPEAEFIDFTVLKTWFEIYMLRINHNIEWNFNADRFLFLTGKPNKIHRALLLKKLLDAGLREKCIWSFFINHDVYRSTQSILALGDDEFKGFLKENLRSPDDIPTYTTGGSMSIHNGGAPYDVSLYQNTSFRIISETHFDSDEVFITEKTYRTIINTHPFIMAGSVGTLARMSSMGFSTFHSYLEIPEYDNITDPYDRIDAIVLNAKHWVSNIKNYQSSIKKNIDGNVERFGQLVSRNQLIVQNICDRLCISVQSLYQSGFFSEIVDKKWLIFYNNVKDDSWPICLTEEHFYDLSPKIQQELIEVFGFRPKSRKY